MQSSTHKFVNNCVRHLPLNGPIYEFGALQVHDDDRPTDLRYLFKTLDVEYVGCDMRAGPGVDKVLNLHRLDLPDETVGTVVCMDTLEHVEFPRKAMSEILRVLKPGGIAIMSSVFQFPIHGYPNDYWRFTPNGFRSLFHEYDGHLVYSYGQSELSPKTVTGVGFKGSVPDIEAFDTSCKKWEIWNKALARKVAEKN
ncbi:MAG: class I SAM-dependent methyltransferase [Hellea sp.]|nr:class I SAM-dependent methyltransferase [Hellea sp.]